MKRNYILKILPVLVLLLCLSTSFVSSKKTLPVDKPQVTTCLPVNWDWSYLIPDYPKFKVGQWYVSINATGGAGIENDVRSTYAFICENDNDEYAILSYMESVWDSQGVSYDVFVYNGCLDCQY